MHKASWIANKRRLRSSRACLLATVNSFALRFFHAYQTYVFLRYVEIYQLPDQFVFEYGVFAANLPGSEQVFQLLQFCQQFEQCADGHCRGDVSKFQYDQSCEQSYPIHHEASFYEETLLKIFLLHTV